MDTVQFISVAIAMAVVDWAWARYSMALADRRAFAGAVWAVLILLPSAFTIVSYVHDPRMLLPAAIGAFVGTYVSVMSKKERD